MTIHHFTNKKALEASLCQEICQKLNHAIAKYDYASMLVSGGSTPIGLFHLLAKEDIEWSKVVIGLVDDRFVPADDEKSNERLVRENLLTHHAAEALFLSLVYQTDDQEENLKIATKVYTKFHPRIDVALLGMGEDGHTASLFPRDPKSQEVLTNGEPSILVNTTADVAPIERVSCSRRLLHKSNHLYLMFTGEKKYEVFQSAAENKYPISYFFETPLTELNVFYSK